MAKTQKLAGSFSMIAVCYGQALLVTLNFFAPKSFAVAMLINFTGAGIFFLMWSAFEKWVLPRITRKNPGNDSK